jgi:acetamidase/formamidase
MSSRHEIRIDRTKTLSQQPGTGHNRWHPDIPPVLRCKPGDEVVLETRDAFDGQFGPGASLEIVARPNLGVVHPLTGPVYVEGAEPGDLLDVEILDIEPDSYGYTTQTPGFGFLRDQFPEPFTRQDYSLPPEFAAPRRFFATTGISVTRDGVDHSEDVTLAARNALLDMIDHLTGRGWTRQQAYAICSVAVDLKISQLVDVPNMLVSAFLPLDIFI